MQSEHLTVERVALLRRVGLFAETPDRALAGVAQFATAVEFPVGAMVMREGDLEDWLYVVVDGPGQVLVRNEFLCVDPAMRRWMSWVANHSDPVPLGGSHAVLRRRSGAGITR